MFGTKIRKLRLEKQLTIPEITDRTGLSNGYLSRIERDVQPVSEKSLYTILTRGFDLRPSEAELMIAEWKMEKILYKLPPSEQEKLMQKVQNKYQA